MRGNRHPASVVDGKTVQVVEPDWQVKSPAAVELGKNVETAGTAETDGEVKKTAVIERKVLRPMHRSRTGWKTDRRTGEYVEAQTSRDPPATDDDLVIEDGASCRR